MVLTIVSRLSAALVAVIITALLVVVPARPAAAASIGPGWGPEDNDGLGFVGAFVAGGTQVYCLEPALPAPLGATAGSGYGGWGSASADDLARASWAIATTGQSSDPRDTVAVNIYVWSLLAPVAYGAHGVSGDDWYAQYVPDPGDRAAMLGVLAWLRATGSGITATPAAGGGTLALSIDPVDEYIGSVTVSGLAPAGAVGTLVLSNATFDATGTSSIAGVGDGAVLPITGRPPSGATPYRVSVDGSFAALSGWRGELALWATEDSQTLAGSGRAADLVFPLAGSDERDRSVLFQPVVTTIADARVEPGTRYRDTLRFALAPDDTGRVDRWYRSAEGAYLPITASCRVYGPLTTRPVPAPAPPPGTPLASSFVVTTGPDGPEVDYPVDSEQALSAIGWYVTQCSIDAGSQLAASRPYLPVGYRFEDAFGVPQEIAVVAFLPTIATAFTTRTAMHGEEVIDRVTVGLAEGP